MREAFKAYALAVAFLLPALPSESALPPQRHIDYDAEHQERVRVGAHKTWLKNPQVNHPVGVTLGLNNELLTVQQFMQGIADRRKASWGY